ncbi:hypothetical protein HanPSC8_Chr10g0435261 [Helianthus annuus]|nr:hypothetical protein HanPSC8_Chr10g0435261 [Helianthus annuus]
MSWIELFKYHNLSINLGACMTPLDEANVSSQALADETTWRFAIISPHETDVFRHMGFRPRWIRPNDLLTL